MGQLAGEFAAACALPLSVAGMLEAPMGAIPRNSAYQSHGVGGESARPQAAHARASGTFEFFKLLYP